MDPIRVRALVGLHVACGGRAGRLLVGRLESALGPLETWWSRRAAVALPQGPTPAPAADLRAPGLDDQVDRALAALERCGFTVDGGDAWPALRALPDPPAALFRRGAPWRPGPTLAVVGARAATAYGVRAVRLLAGAAAEMGALVVSGLARGIDAEAHRAALDAGGATLAVLGAGPDRPYPPEHAALQERIGNEGTLLTEHLPGVRPLARHFPRRNRLLAALADAVLLVEARLKSGSLTTVRWAADLGRDVLVVPGPIDAPLSEAPIELLREGATPVACRAHLAEALGLDAGAGEVVAAADVADEADPATPHEERLLALARGAPVDLDALVRLSGEAPSRVLAIVLSLEARGRLLREADGRSFRAR
ncbi:MAG TPA: DNA-processing protein DprA [Planctomycetota bacterium]|nr:DNA-processing protein DprA [Planctomycetota bacterium]